MCNEVSAKQAESNPQGQMLGGAIANRPMSMKEKLQNALTRMTQETAELAKAIEALDRNPELESTLLAIRRWV